MKRNEITDVNSEKPTKRTSLWVFVGVMLLFSVGAVFWYQRHDERVIQQPVPVPKDTLAKANNTAAGPADSMKQGGVPASADGRSFAVYRIVTEGATLKDGRQLNFGQKVYVEQPNANAKQQMVFLQDPAQHSQVIAHPLNGELLVEDDRFEDYKSNFSLLPFAKLDVSIKKLLLQENYSDGNDYRITQNAQRAKSTIAYGDFDEDGLQDVAVLMDNNNKQISRLLVICFNEVTKEPYIAFSENYADKMKVRSYQKGAPIFMDTKTFVDAPRDGLIISSDDVMLSILYDRKSQKFKTYFQQ